VTRRLLLGYLSVTVAVLVLLEVPLGLFYGQRELERRSAELYRDAAIIATIYEDALEGAAEPDPGPAFRYEDRTGARVVIVDVDGVSIVDTEQPTARDFTTRPEIAAALAGQWVSGRRPSETLGTQLLYVAMPVASGGEVHGALRLTITAAGTHAQIARFWWGLGAVATVVLATMALVGLLLARSVTRPLRDLQRMAERFSSGDLRTDAEGAVAGPPELQALARTMSTMAVRLDAVLQQQRTFVADASHQLRTPLTALRLRLENLQSDLEGAPAAELEAVIGETDRLSRLVNELLQLARAERAGEPVALDLAALTVDRVDTWSAVAESAGVGLQFDRAEGAAGAAVAVRALPGAIEQILDNVLDNAIAATPAGRSVHVSIDPPAGPGSAPEGHDGIRHRLVIADEGPGLPDADKQRALSRFWRGSSTTGGTGLGLPIAHALAAASGGSLDLLDRPGGGLAVVVSFPVATAAGGGRAARRDQLEHDR
jgi:signal transduction histidine kinase